MNATARPLAALVSAVLLTSAFSSIGQDWPQWRGPNRDAKTSFAAPKIWPKELTKKWQTSVGSGVATPALVGDRLFVFTRDSDAETLRCLNAATGKELWLDKYETAAPTRPGSGFNNEFIGPRSSPAVASGKVVTIGARGTISCVDAASGKVLWRKDEFRASPQFFNSSSPIISDGLCIAQLGGRDNGAVVAYDLASGAEKWKWSGEGETYSSPSLMTVGGARFVIAMTGSRVVALAAADGKLAWESPFPLQGRGGYNACTPMVSGDTLIFSGAGRGTKALKLERAGNAITSKELWSNPEKSVQYNTPVANGGLIFGLTTATEFFCLNAQSGQTLWSAPSARAAATTGGEPKAPGTEPKGPGGKKGFGGGYAGYGSIVDAGSVLLALTPVGELIVVQPTGKAFTELARIKVAEAQAFAHPVVSGNRVFIKDRDAVTLWTAE